MDSVQSANQNGKFQVVVVDYASRDETTGIINEKKTKNLDFIQNMDNVGFTKAVNQGVKIAGGEYLFILNPDTQLTEGSVERLMKQYLQIIPSAWWHPSCVSLEEVSSIPAADSPHFGMSFRK